MHTIDLAYVGRGLHEELVAYIADQQGYYADEGVHVALRDGCAWDEERLRHVATIGLGRAGLDPDLDIRAVVRPPGDYGMDLRRLSEGRIDAALVGSTMAPEAVAAEHGWRVLAWVGDHFQVPTVGVAVDPTYLRPDDPSVQAVVRAHRRALRVIHDEPGTAVRHLRTFLGRHTAEEARAHYETFIAPYFTTEGQADLAVGAAAITAVAAELGVPATVTAAEFYRTGTAPAR
ncbi:ABC transporter substrate-binding protein [Nonomuraea jabiensis]|uniref:ABC-type nitrate/sulfonate/bicarbonate transport system substrate-binding protein n=1 Tax=Nonomuraea jabiensis TaxID=882448 RepID=A0A7W9LID6_9ACTN|nr:ABC transporter substrate-binding protein [Nonomuraea jabiensis]MBB5784930.1 ABC-type nitrate/sulfonate/bicarbonate transport system substrate-binding protein [Nonomuraea jabiensis]